MRQIIIKNDVELEKMKPAILWALFKVAPCFWKRGYTVVITGGSEDGHGGGDNDKTLHDDGLAVDLRSKHLKQTDKWEILGEMVVILGWNFDVLLELEGAPSEHFHVEMDVEDGH